MLSGATSPAGSSERCASRDGRNNPRPLLNVSIPQDHAAQLVIDLAARAENERDGIAQQIVEEVNSEQELVRRSFCIDIFFLGLLTTTMSAF